MSRYTVEAVVLKAVYYQDSDKIYTLFSPDRGKISASAKGVRKINSRRGGNLDTLNHILAGISESSNKFKTITEVKTLESFKNLKKGLKNSARGFYTAELVYNLLEEGESNEIFWLLLETLRNLDDRKEDPVLTVNNFEVSLMGLLGYAMFLDRCSNCGRPYSTKWEFVKFNPSYGGFSCDRCNLGGVRVERKAADVLYHLKAGQVEKAFSLGRTPISEADRLIKIFIRYVLEDTIKTERVFGDLG